MVATQTFWHGGFIHNFSTTPLPSGGTVVRQYRMDNGLPEAVYTVMAVPWTRVSENPIRNETTAISVVDVSWVAKPATGPNENYLYVTFANTGFHPIRSITVWVTETRKA